MERCARQRREQFRDCGTEEKRRFSLGLTKMDRITKGRHRLALSETVWIRDYINFTYRCKKRAKSRLVRVWVEPGEASVKMSHGASFLRSLPRQWSVAKGPDEELVDALTLASNH